MGDSSTIRIHRTHVPKRDRLRPYKVMIDGERSGSVADDRIEDFTVAPGEHSVQLRLDWTGSRTVQVDAQSGETAVLTATAHQSTKSALGDLFHSVTHREDWIELVAE